MTPSHEGATGDVGVPPPGESRFRCGLSVPNCIVLNMTTLLQSPTHLRLAVRGPLDLAQLARQGFGDRDESAFDGVLRRAFCLDGDYERQVGVEVRQAGRSLELDLHVPSESSAAHRRRNRTSTCSGRPDSLGGAQRHGLRPALQGRSSAGRGLPTRTRVPAGAVLLPVRSGGDLDRQCASEPTPGPRAGRPPRRAVGREHRPGRSADQRPAYAEPAAEGRLVAGDPGGSHPPPARGGRGRPPRRARRRPAARPSLGGGGGPNCDGSPASARSTVR